VRSRRKTTVAVALTAAAATALTTGAASAGTSTGPSTTIQPYVIPVAAGVDTTSLFTVGDKTASNGYKMVGIPDGLGVIKDGRDQVVFMNHELQNSAGIVRRHGQAGAFVSRLVIDRKTGEVKSGSDLIDPGVRYWNYQTKRYAAAPVPPTGAAPGTHTAAFARFCSGALTAPGQLNNGRHGYDGQLYFANEESGDEGRAFAVTTNGAAYQLPRLGLFSWENTLAAANESDTTLVMGNEDGGNGQLRAYVGTKQRDGSPVNQAGLTNGTLSVINVPSIKDATSSAVYGKGVSRPFQLAQIDTDKNGRDQNIEAAADGTALNRIEDGAFDPQQPNDYYFLTTEGGDKTPDPTDPPNTSRDGGGLWRLSFKNIEKPELGGRLTLLLDGTEAPFLNKPDNMTIDNEGHLIIQEDPGNNAHVARILSYRLRQKDLTTLARFDPALFSTPSIPGTLGTPAQPRTIDEESSGIIEVRDGQFLFDAQVHTPSGNPETVEFGQLLTMTVDFDEVYPKRSRNDRDDRRTS